MNNIKNEILSIMKLEDGWNYGDGIAITEEASLIALAISDILPTSIYKNIEPFPLNDGSISLRITLRENLTIGLIINSEDNIHAFIDDEDGIENFDIIFPKVLKKAIRDNRSMIKREVKKNKKLLLEIVA